MNEEAMNGRVGCKCVRAFVGKPDDSVIINDGRADDGFYTEQIERRQNDWIDGWIHF